jgi:WXXGXW repeat (2 copies)
MVEEAFMQKKMARLVLPATFAVIAAFASAPASAQIRVGVDLPSIHIRVAPDAPPPMRHEIQMVRPSRRHVWIGGYWDRQDDRWAWAPGRWEEPDRRGVRWVRPRYQPERGFYRYEPGHWSHQRMEEGDDYRRWRKEHGRGHEKHHGHDGDR